MIKGNTFHRAHGWITQLRSRAVYPAGYEPAQGAPMADFLSKLTESRYVSQAHCDGFTPDPTVSCLPPGESLTTTTTFTVLGRH